MGNNNKQQQQTMRIVGIAGSIRKQGYSRQVLEHVKRTVDEKMTGVQFHITDISQLPLFNQDTEEFGSAPEQVTKFREDIKGASAVLIVTPEHNYCVPAALKNALDWGSRPFGKNAFEDKPGAVISCSPGMLGGVKAQNRLKYILSTGLNVHLVNRPEVIVPAVHQKLDKEGRLIDEFVTKNIEQLLHELVQWTT